MARIEMELRNLPRFRIMEYLIEAGGIRPDDEALSVEAEGWSARLEEMEPAKIITMLVRRDMLIIEGDNEAIIEPIHYFMRQKTMRGGG